MKLPAHLRTRPVYTFTAALGAFLFAFTLSLFAAGCRLQPANFLHGIIVSGLATIFAYMAWPESGRPRELVLSGLLTVFLTLAVIGVLLGVGLAFMRTDNPNLLWVLLTTFYGVIGATFLVPMMLLFSPYLLGVGLSLMFRTE